MKKYYPYLILLIFISLLPSSCMDDDLWLEKNKPNLSFEEVLKRGIIILNEGNFMYGNASLSYYNPETGKIINDVFYQQNGIPLGDVAESAELFDGELYIVMNNSGKVMAVNMGKYPSLKAFDITHKITGLLSPRYIHFFDKNKAYITDLYAKQIYVVDPYLYKVKGSINVNNRNPDFYQHPTEQLVTFGDKIFTNCYSFDNKILVIDSKTDALIDSIEVLAQPNSMVLDKNQKLWVLCDGGYDGSSFNNTDAGLIRIDPVTRTIEKIFILPDHDWPSELTLNGNRDTLYFIHKDIWSMSVNSNILPDVPLIPATDSTGSKLFYSIGVDPYNSDIYVADAIDHVQNGRIYRFSAQVHPLDTITAGISPGFFYFTRKE